MVARLKCIELQTAYKSRQTIREQLISLDLSQPLGVARQVSVGRQEVVDRHEVGPVPAGLNELVVVLRVALDALGAAHRGADADLN